MTNLPDSKTGNEIATGEESERETITDEQIRELRDWLRKSVIACDVAMARPQLRNSRHRAWLAECRARCAEIWNARHAIAARTPAPDDCSTCGAIHTDVDCFGAEVSP